MAVYIKKAESLTGNKWVVPYNPYLSKEYNCQINVEICATIQRIKYLFKYVYKVHDCANISLAEPSEITLQYNEIKSFLDTRYIRSPEAVRFAVNITDEQTGYFETKKTVILPKDTSTAYFFLNCVDIEARNYIYPEITRNV